MPRRGQIEDDQNKRAFKSFWLIGLVSFFFLILIFRLIFIQVIQADVNIRLSNENQMRLRTLSAPRGRIFDRNGVPLARNRPSYSIYVIPYKMKKGYDIVGNLLKVLDTNGTPVFDSLELVRQLKKARYRRFDKTRLKEDVSMDIVSIIEEHSMQLPGIVVETEVRREYTMGATTFHVIGYMSEIPERQFAKLKKQGYRYGALIGKSGIEKEYESEFKGVDGREYVEVNAYGRSMGTIPNMPHTDAIPGNDIYLTLDSRLQKVAQEAFPDTMKGAVVAIDPRTGEVLVMYSSPSMDPNIFSLSTSKRAKMWAKTAGNSNKPLNNRATTGTYAPGSTFKLVSSIAGLNTGTITEKQYMPVPCHGSYRFGNRVAHCWKRSGHGALNVIGAVKKSCNVYFYQLGLKIGDQTIVDYAKMFGLGQKTGIDLPRERIGYLSGEIAHNKRFANKIKENKAWSWTKSLVMDMAIGQSQVVTPLQLALMVGGLGNGKNVYKPYLLKEVRSRDGIMLRQRTPEVLHHLNITPKALASIHLAMKEVILPGGTGGRARVPGISIGGKTGSAENPQGDKTHALFVVSAPIENPVISMAVVVENGGHGGSIAAPIAGAVLRYYFSQTDEGKAIVEKAKSDKKSK